jgi:hypothetical protein
MHRELSLNSLTRHNAANDEHLASPTATASDDHARENLNSLFIAFQNLGVHIHRITNVKWLHISLEAGLFNFSKNLLAHDSNPRTEFITVDWIGNRDRESSSSSSKTLFHQQNLENSAKDNSVEVPH